MVIKIIIFTIFIVILILTSNILINIDKIKESKFTGIILYHKIGGNISSVEAQKIFKSKYGLKVMKWVIPDNDEIKILKLYIKYPFLYKKYFIKNR